MSSEEEFERNVNVAAHAANMAAWYGTKLELDKSLLTLSVGGVGLLITLLTTVGVSSAEGFVLYVSALASFLVCLVAILFIFKANSAHIEAIIHGKAQSVDPWLYKLDTAATISFAFGVVFAAVIGISAALNSYSLKVKTMTNENKQQQQNEKGINQGSRPVTDFTKSFNGAVNIQPSSLPQLQGSSTSSAVSTPTLSPPASPPSTTAPPEAVPDAKK